MRRYFASALFCFGFLVACLAAGRAQAQTPAAWSPQTMIELRRVSQVRPSPDGRRVAYTVSQAVMTDDRSEFVSQIWLANADGSDAAQITFHEKSSSNPQWSPDGRWLAFTSERSGKNNLYRLRLSGGEAEQLTEVKSGIGVFAWSPDGRQIAFVMKDAPSEADEKNAKAKDDARWVDRDLKHERLYILNVDDANGGKAKREPRLLTSGDLSVAGATRPGGSTFDWSPDGKQIVFAHRKSAEADDWTSSDVSLVDVASGHITPLAATGAAEFSPMFSPNGQSVAMVASDNPPRWAGCYSLKVVPASGGEPKSLPETFDQQPSLVGWSADGSRLYYSEARGTLVRLYGLGIESGKTDDLYAGDDLLRSVELNASRTMLGFVRESPRQPPEACVSTCEKVSPVQVSRVNAQLRPPLGKVEVLRWSSPDGRQIEGILTYPVDYKQGQRVPLLLYIHGGPAGVFQQTYPGAAGVYPLAAFSSRGYAVLQPNPRGSSGYGREFRFANYQDWGGADFKDLMAGVDHAIERGIADPQRLGVMGWSYGGYMTSWTITQTRRFKAASVGAAVTNLVSFTGTADIPSFLPDYWGSQPWVDSSLYRARSAVFQAQGVTTPTLIQHGDADVRVPISQGYEFYNALKQQGATVEMLVLPRQPHAVTEPRMIVKAMQTNLDWFEKHLGRPDGASGRTVPAPRDVSASPDGTKTVDFRSLVRIAEEELRESRTPGAAIALVQGERIVFAGGVGVANVETSQPVTPDMLFRLGSTTKMFTAAALVSLAEEGRLKLEGPIGSYVPGLHESIAALTPHQLLTHTAGLTDESVMTGLHDDSALAAGIRKMDGSWLFTQPGRLHSYSNPGYWIAGLVSEQVAGKPYADVLEERLFRPLGMSRTTLRPTAAMTWPLALGHEVRRGSPAIIRPQADNAATWPAGQMYSSVEELARFVIALMHEGQLEGRQVLSPTLIERLTQPYVPRPGTSDHYGYGLAIGKRHGATIVSHGGSRAGYGSTIQMAPEHKAAVIILANRSGSSLPRTAVKALELLLPASAGDVKAAESTTAEKPTSLSEAEMASLAGIYTNRRQTIELTVREGKLTMRRRGGEGNEQGTPLQKAGDSRLTTSSTSGGGTLLHIVRDENGNPEYLCSGGRAFKRQPAASGESSSGL